MTEILASIRGEEVEVMEEIDETGEMFPDIDLAISGFDALVQWIPAPNGVDKIPEPVKGCDQNYDNSKQKIREIEY